MELRRLSRVLLTWTSSGRKRLPSFWVEVTFVSPIIFPGADEMSARQRFTAIPIVRAVMFATLVIGGFVVSSLAYQAMGGHRPTLYSLLLCGSLLPAVWFVHSVYPERLGWRGIALDFALFMGASALMDILAMPAWINAIFWGAVFGAGHSLYLSLTKRREKLTGTKGSEPR
jgi:hypothetical protein